MQIIDKKSYFLNFSKTIENSIFRVYNIRGKKCKISKQILRGENDERYKFKRHIFKIF